MGNIYLISANSVKTAEAYMDDILIYAKTKDELKETTEAVNTRIKDTRKWWKLLGT